jgi:membrane-bound ClpP family serine protease
MCHLLLLLPVLALPVFWVLPLGIALPLYAAAAGIALAVYALALKAWRTPVVNGTQVLLGATGRVVRVGKRETTLWVGSELWSADVDGVPLALGDEAVVVAVDRLRLTVRNARSGNARKNAQVDIGMTD